MGQSGKLIFYTPRRLEDPPTVLRKLVLLAEPEHVLEPFRSVGDDRGWEDFLNDGPGIRDEMFPRPHSIEELGGHYKEGTRLAIDAVGSLPGSRIEQAVAAAIPASIRGDFLPGDLVVRIGYHDLFDTAEHDDGLFIARPFLSIGFFGYSTPTDWDAFRAAVFQIPEVQAVKREFEAITGPLEQCITWSV